MMTATKTVNYTEAQTQEIVSRYQAGETIEVLAEAFGKTTKSIVAKLAREKVYQAKTKTANHTVRKADLITKIATALGRDEEVLESLEKATKEALEVIAEAVAK